MMMPSSPHNRSGESRSFQRSSGSEGEKRGQRYDKSKAAGNDNGNNESAMTNDDEDKKTAANNPSRKTSFCYLSFEEMSETLSFVDLTDRCHLLSTCKSLWHVRTHLDGLIRYLDFTPMIEDGNGTNGKNDVHLIPPNKDEMMEAKLHSSDDNESSSIMADLALLQQSRFLFFSRLVNLCKLDLGSLATDGFLRLLSSSWDLSTSPENIDHYEVPSTPDLLLLPSLTHLAMARSQQITDNGLLKLIDRNKHNEKTDRLCNIQYLDLTFCRNTTYQVTLTLRNHLPNLRVVRRQPSWLDGRFITPFHSDTNSSSTGNDDDDDDEENVEIHTYWPDGSFSFGRHSQSEGFVMDLFEFQKITSNGRKNNHLGDKLQYNNFHPPVNWPSWSKFVYRPGVSLLRIPPYDDDDDNDDISNNNNKNNENVKEDNHTKSRSVLVAQLRYGIRPPRNFPKIEHATLVPLGETRYFSRTGELLDDSVANHNDAERQQQNDNNNTNEDREWYVMVSHMEVLPLTDLATPPEILERNEAFCKEMEDVEEASARGAEEALHFGLRGYVVPQEMVLV